jgi:hypothetical protein
MKSPKLQPGDIIVTDRFIYKHYGIYAGRGRVIHYAAENGDFGNNIEIRESSLSKFTENNKYDAIEPIKGQSRVKPFSPQETVRRARSRIGEKRYNLIFNNCEHFALWCKYGKNKSVQVEKAVSAAAILGTAIIALKIMDSNER